jgi:glycosyltransferase involved in cell wall biosynthesis
MLKRAGTSVLNQTFRDFDWVIVNDRGSREGFDALAHACICQKIPLHIVETVKDKGMVAALNVGIKASQSDFIAIHDDDDSWDSRFLERMVATLIQPFAKSVRGVVCRCTKVIERVTNDQISEIDRKPYNPTLETVTLYDIAHLDNIYPPISFLYRRDVFDTIGHYREDIPVLGDWDFNLRFLMKYDIQVLPDFLAFYHFRENRNGIYANSLVGALSLHIQYAAYLRNDLLRKDLAASQVGLGFLVNICHDFNRTLKQMNLIRKDIKTIAGEPVKPVER